jgi:hypothetical protein
MQDNLKINIILLEIVRAYEAELPVDLFIVLK